MIILARRVLGEGWAGLGLAATILGVNEDGLEKGGPGCVWPPRERGGEGNQKPIFLAIGEGDRGFYEEG